MIKDVNEIFDSYDLFGSTEKIIENIHTKYPGISESEIEIIMNYLDDFFNFCAEYGQKLADKYKCPFLPRSDEGEKEIDIYLDICKEKYPEINEEQIVGIFSTVCWLSNR